MSVDSIKRVGSLLLCAAALSSAIGMFSASQIAAQEQPSEEETEPDPETEPTTPDQDGEASECSWPEEMNPDSGREDVCFATRAQLRCSTDDGRMVFCSSDDGVSCTADESLEGLELHDCESMCGENELYASCSPGPWPERFTPEPPSSCTSLPPFPGGFLRYCCPCS